MATQRVLRVTIMLLVVAGLAAFATATLVTAQPPEPQAGEPASPTAAYAPQLDVNHDGIISILDIQMVAGAWTTLGSPTIIGQGDRFGGVFTATNTSGVSIGALGVGSQFGVAGTSTTGGGLYGYHGGSTGTQAGVTGETNSTSPNAAGVYGRVLPAAPGASSAGIYGYNAGTGASGIGVRGEQAGAGWGVYGRALSGRGVFGETTTTSGATFGVFGKSVSPAGHAVYGENLSGGVGVGGYSNSNSGLYGQSGTGPGVFGEATSTSAATKGVYGRSVSPSGHGVFGEDLSGGVGVGGYSNSNSGVYGQSTTGPGVYGYASNGVGVRAQGGGSTKTALEVTNGAIKITGAGVNTSTPVYQHEVHHSGGSANICNDPTFGFGYSALNHPLLNNNPDAIIFLNGSRNALIVRYQPPGCPAGRWVVTKPGLSTPDDNDTVNILIFVP
jgi:hypothetical protein